MNILYLAPVYYDDMKQRPQQIAECLAKHHKVYYIEPTVSLMRWLHKGGRTFRGRKKIRNRNLRVIRLNGCLTMHKSLEIFDICGINNWSELLQLRGLIQKCDVVWTGYSGWYTLIRHIRQKMIVFDKMDEEDLLASSACLKRTLKRNKQKLTELADLIFVTSSRFYEQLKGKKKNVFQIPNAVSCKFAPGVVSYEDINRIKRFGYVGTISEWFDTAVIEKLLALDARFEIDLVGRNYLKEINNPRVHYLGVRKNEELAGIIQTFDICLYNFKQTPLLDTINPVKIYEYLSLNKPVLAVRSKETLQMQDYLMLYGNIDEIERIIFRGHIKRPFSNPVDYQRFLKDNSWEARTARIEKALKAAKKDFETG